MDECEHEPEHEDTYLTEDKEMVEMLYVCRGCRLHGYVVIDLIDHVEYYSNLIRWENDGGR
jgi:hypothetical protein